jgi:hypothetical protein
VAVPFAVRTGLMVCSRWRHSACRARRRAILSGLKRPVHARICRRLPYLDARAVPARNVPSPPRLPSPAGRTGRVWDYLRLCGAKPELWEEPRRRPLAQRMALASRRRPWRGLFLRAAASAPHQPEGAVTTSSMPTKFPWRSVRVLDNGCRIKCSQAAHCSMASSVGWHPIAHCFTTMSLISESVKSR